MIAAHRPACRRVKIETGRDYWGNETPQDNTGDGANKGALAADMSAGVGHAERAMIGPVAGSPPRFEAL